MSSNTPLRPPTRLQEEPLQYTDTYSQLSRDTALNPTNEGLSGYTTVGSPQNTFSEAGGSRSGWHDTPAASTLGKSVKIKADPDAIDQGLESTVESTQRQVKTESHQVKTEGDIHEMPLSNVLPNFRAAAPGAPLCQLTWWSAGNPNQTFSVSKADLTKLGLSSRPADAGTRDLGLFARTVTAGEPPAVLVKIDDFWSVYLPEKRSAWNLQGQTARVHSSEKWIPTKDEITKFMPESNRAVKRLWRRLYKGVGRISRQDKDKDEGVAWAATRLTIIALSGTDLSRAHLREEVNCDNLTFEASFNGACRNGHWFGLSNLYIDHLSHCSVKLSCEEAHLSQRGRIDRWG